MKATEKLRELGQSLWLDNITREMLDSGTLQRYIDDYSVTGVTSNPAIFDKAIASGGYDEAIRVKAASGAGREQLFFDLAIEDLRRAADMLRPVHEAIAAGVPVNVTLLFSAEHYLAAADAFCRGADRRIEAGLDPAVGSVASVFMSRWDAAVMNTVPDELRDRLALAVGLKTYKAYRDFMSSDRWQRLANSGARMQRLLWASTSTKDPKAPDTLYVHCLGAPFTVNTIPEATLEAFYDHGYVGMPMAADGGDSDKTLAEFASAGVDVDALAAKLQSDAATGFVEAWNDLMAHIDEQSAALRA